MATFKSVVFLLVAAAAIVQAKKISPQESLNFLQQANTFDPENLNEPEGFFAPEETDLPGGDRELIYSGPEGREACVVCQRASPVDDDTIDAIRKLKKEVGKLRQLVADSPRTRKPRKGREESPDQEPAPEDIQEAPAPVEDQPDAPVDDQPAPDTQEQAPDAPVDAQPAPDTQEQAPDAPVDAQPAPDSPDQTPDTPDQEQAPQPEPLLPEEQPVQLLTELNDIPVSDPALNDTMNQVKDILNQTAQSPELPKTPEEIKKRAADLKVAEKNLETLAEKETDPAKKTKLITIIKRIKRLIRKTVVVKKTKKRDQDQPEPLLPEEQPDQIRKDLDDLASPDPALNDTVNKVKDVLTKAAQSPETKTPEEVQQTAAELKLAEQDLEKMIEKETDPERKKRYIIIIRRIKKYITTIVRRKVKSHFRTKNVVKNGGKRKGWFKNRNSTITRTGSHSMDQSKLRKGRTFTKTRVQKGQSGSRDMSKVRSFKKSKVQKVGSHSNNGVRRHGAKSTDVTKTKIFSNNGVRRGGAGSRDVKRQRTSTNNGVRRGGAKSTDVKRKRTSTNNGVRRGGSGSSDNTRTRTSSQIGSGSSDSTRTRTSSQTGSGSSDNTRTRTSSQTGSGSSDNTRTRTSSQTDSGSSKNARTRTSSQTGSGSSKNARTKTSSQQGTRSGGADRTKTRTSSGGEESEETYVTTNVEETVEYETREEYVK